MQGKSYSSKGGLIIYLNKQYDYIPKLKLNKYNTWEGQFMQVRKGETLSKPINLEIYTDHLKTILSITMNS